MNSNSPSRSRRLVKRSSPTTARRVLKRLWKSYTVQSCADGTLRILPKWNSYYGKPGVLTRMYAAAMVEDVINGS